MTERREGDRGFVTDGSVSLSGDVLARVIDAGATAILLVDPRADVIRAVTPAAGALLGGAPADLVGSPTSAVAADAERFRAVVDRTVRTGDAWTDAVGFVTTEGTQVETELSTARIEIGEDPYALVFIRDVTERRRHERDFDEQYTRLRAIVENAPIVLFTVDADGVFTQSEGRGLARLGLDPGEVIGTAVEELYGDFEAIIDPISRALDGEDVNGIVEIDGTVFETWYRPVFGTDGAVEQVIGVAIDVTDRRRHQKRLERLNEASREFMSADTAGEIAAVTTEIVDALLDEAATALWAAGDDGRLVAVDPAGSGESGTERVLPADAPAAAVHRAGEPRTLAGDEARCGVDAETVHAVPLGSHGVLCVGVDDPDGFRDTERELVEILARDATAAFDRADRIDAIREREAELRRQNERLEAFASVVSHDLRNPMSVLQGYLELAQKEGDVTYLDEMEETLDRMDALIEDVLALAREGRVVGDLEPVDLDAVATAAWDGVTTGDATLNIETDSRILADGDRLSRLLENLFGNAVEHGDDDVSVWFGDLEAGFYVADDGPGIPVEDHERVFEPAYSTARDGTGFGLAIVEEIATAHGWTVSIAAAETGGARFEVTGVEAPDAGGTGTG